METELLVPSLTRENYPEFTTAISVIVPLAAIFASIYLMFFILTEWKKMGPIRQTLSVVGVICAMICIFAAVVVLLMNAPLW